MRLVNIGRFLPYYDPMNVNGPQNQVILISRGLKELEKINTYLFHSNSKKNLKKNKMKLIAGKIKFQILGFNYTKFDINENLISRIDVIHAHSFRSGEIVTSFRLAKKNNIPFILTPHGEIFSHLYIVPKLFKPLYYGYDALIGKKIISKSDHIVCNSEYEKRQILKYNIPEEKITVIHPPKMIKNYLHNDCDHHNMKQKGDKKQILKIISVARWSKNRRLNRIVNVAYKLHKKSIPFEWSIIGGDEVNVNLGGFYGNLSKAKIFVHENNLPVKFYGRQNESEIIGLLKEHHLFVYLSEYENYGQPIAEAILTGLPIISTPVGLVNDLKKYPSVMLVDHNDYNVVEKIIDLINNYPPRVELKNIQDWLSNKVSINTVVKQYSDLYNQMVRQY
jgi:glycosyltransferase involved in cell wall biosynthesis